jgi:hypothetical protein
MNSPRCSCENPYSCTCVPYWTPRRHFRQFRMNLCSQQVAMNSPQAPHRFADNSPPISFPSSLLSTSHQSAATVHTPYNPQSCHVPLNSAVYFQFAHTPTRLSVQSFHSLPAPPASFLASCTENHVSHFQPTASRGGKRKTASTTGERRAGKRSRIPAPMMTQPHSYVGLVHLNL